jgi:hypothetical protein
MYANPFSKLCLRSEKVHGTKQLTSPGQQGGGMCLKDGRLLGIYTGIAGHDESTDGDLGLCVRMTEPTINWVKQQFA